MTRYLHIKSFVGFLFLLLATASCSNEEEAIVMPSNESLKLQVTTVDNAITRSIDGVDALNENLFKRLDYYFFAANDDDQQLKLLKSETNLSDNTTHVSNIRFSDADLTDIFGNNSNTNGATCYVYVVANLDLDNNTLLSPTTISNQITLGQLKKVTFQTEGISKNAKQPSFVMYGGGPLKLNITGDKKTVSGEVIRVTRDAAKVSLTVTNIETQVDVKDDAGNVIASYAPDLKGMYVMFYNGMNKSTIHSLIGQDSHYRPSKPDDGYFTLNNMSPDPKEEGDQHEWRQLVAKNGSEPNKNLTHEFPYYTYLTDWREGSGYEDYASYMILVVPWGLLDDDGNVASYQPTYYMVETTPTNRGIYSYYENHYYMININIGMLGSWVLPEPVKVEAKYMVVPWGEVDVPATLREGEYLILETRNYTMNNIDSASIPYISSHAITQAYVTKVEYVNTGDFRHVPINNPRNPGGTADTDGDYTTNTYVNNERFVVSTNDNKLTLNHTISPDQFTRYDVTVTIKNAADLEDQIVFTIYPAIYADIEPGDNVFINGRFGHVQNPPGNQTQRVNPAWYSSNGYSWSSNENRRPTFVNVGPGDGDTSYGSLVTSQTGAQVSLTRITVTSFSKNNVFKVKTGSNGTPETRSYVLTDPRVYKENFNSTIEDYWETAGSNRNTPDDVEWRTKHDIMVGSSAGDVIAPEFLISSTWGRTQGMNGRTFENSEKRCATYQEAGYPAGRWRLPTEAELCFIYGLQNKGIIPVLFKSEANNPYWASSGRGISGVDYDATNDTHVFLTNPNTQAPGRVGLRCVYDLWYWGETRYKDTSTGINVYHAEP